MFPNYSFQKNLHYPEIGVNFCLNIFLHLLDKLIFFNPEKFETSVNNYLLDIYDKSDSKGQISFIPIEFLRNYFKNENSNIQNNKFKNEIEEKRYYVKLLIQNKIDENFYKINNYQNVPLEYFRKPLLFASLTKTVDFCKISTNENSDLGLIFDKVKKFNPKDIDRDMNEWMSKTEIMNFITPQLFTLPDLKKMIYFIPLIYIKYNYNVTNKDFIYSEILHSYDWKNIPKEKRFIISIILYNSHFTSCIVDLNCKVNNDLKKVGYFFNSCGYNPYKFNKNKNYWFIDSCSKITNHNKIEPHKKNNDNLTIEAFCDLLKTELSVTNFVFNSFSIQELDSECGIFSMMFLFYFLEYLKKIKNFKVIDMKYVYHNILFIGGDLTYSMIRGLFYFTNEDLEKNYITNNDYLNSPYVYPIKNRKFNEFSILYQKNYKKIQKKINK